MKKILVIILSVFMISIIIFSCLKVYDLSSEVTLIQLATTNNDRMMGYIMITKNKDVIVIDGGNYEDGEKLASYIQKYGNEVDYWFITHYHKDHTGAFRYIVENTDIKVNNFYHSLPQRENVAMYDNSRIDDYDNYIKAVNNDRIKNNVNEIYLNDEIKIDNVNVKILGIKNEEITNNFGNNQSVVYKFLVGKTSILFLGDTGLESEEKLKQHFRNELKCDYVQMAHHGQAGVSEEMYKIINPKFCLWPCPKWVYNNDLGEGFNTGNLKTIETRNWIDKLGAKSYIAYDKEKVIKIH